MPRALPLVCLMSVATIASPADSPLALSDVDTVIVRAAEAWEGEEHDVIELRGQVEIRAPDWAILADTATLRGRLEDPDEVVVAGDPARIRVMLRGRDDDLEGQSERIVYDRANDTLSLAGGAQLNETGRAVSSGSIDYLIGRRVFRTSGDERVRIVLDPDLKKF